MPVPLPNLRDVGGLRTPDGRTTRHGVVLRSAMPAADDLVPDEIQWPPAVVLDLRSRGELEEQHPLVPAGSEVVNLPLLSSLKPDDVPPGDLAALYLVLLDTARDLLVELVDRVARADGPALVHCAAGKDRTGVSVALLLSLVGVERDLIVEDYLKSVLATDAIDARLKVVPGHRHRASLPPSYLAVPVEAIDGVLDAWHGHADGPAGWYLAAGGTEDTLHHLRRRLVP